MRTFVSNQAASQQLLAALVPDMTVLDVQIESNIIRLTILSTILAAVCPRCGGQSNRIHRYYVRRPQDLPISGYATHFVLHARRFRCINSVCPTVTFAERLPQLVAPAAQRTIRLNTALRDLALAFGGEAGARHSMRSGMPVSGDTLLRRAHAAAPPERPTPRVLGIDDFSFRKGQVFGTILTDGERHNVVDLLPDRTAETAATWLRAHPGTEIVTRDRSADYTRAISTGAPHAVQVADRFHIVKNAGETLERVLHRHHQAVRLAAKAMDAQHIQQTTVAADGHQPRSQSPPALESPAARSAAQQRRLARYQEVKALAADGLGPKAIAQQIGLTRQTVAMWLRTGSFPERSPSAPRRMRITPYEPYLRERWRAGAYNSRQLWREIGTHGFTGGCATVRRRTARWPMEDNRCGSPSKQRTNKPTLRSTRSPITRTLSPRQVCWLLLKPTTELKPEQQQYIEHLGGGCSEVVTAQQLVLTFLDIVSKRAATSLQNWLTRAQASGLPELVEFAKGIVRDQDAVTAALHYEHANGITEGHVHRLKMIKRTSYGRASFTLLRQRVLAQV